MDYKELDIGLKNLYSGVIYDALYFDLNYKKSFTLDSKIQPINYNNLPCFGYAFTCKGGPVISVEDINDDIRLNMFDSFKANCIQIIASGGKRNIAQFGDISARLAKKFGAKGAVIDAPTRDKKFIGELNFPVFCRGTNPKDAYGNWQIWEYESEIIIAGIDEDVVVQSNDIIFCDADGVLVIPKNLIHETIESANKRALNEQKIRNIVNKSINLNPINLNRDLGRW